MLAKRQGIWCNGVPLGNGARQTGFSFMEGQYMSRVVSPPQTQPSSSSTSKVPHEKIAMRAYEKWCKRGRPQGTDRQDWVEAEAELRAELGRSSGSSTTASRH